MKLKVSKEQWREMKSAQAVAAKKAQDPNFFKSLPEAERIESQWKL